jgi:hypothetical protein
MKKPIGNVPFSSKTMDVMIKQWELHEKQFRETLKGAFSFIHSAAIYFI